MNNNIKEDETFKLPRLYVEATLSDQGVIELSPAQAHYLHTVLRRSEKEKLRLFNGRDGEWLGTLSSLNKKQAIVTLSQQLLKQPEHVRKVHLIFTPIKKHRMDWLIEKAVELGATDFHPVLSQNTENRKIKDDRLNAQIFEAAEQCERLEIPILHALEKLDYKLSRWSQDIPVLACIDRFDAHYITDCVDPMMKKQDIAVLIGPEGGFTIDEKEQIAAKSIPVSLGDTILRCETAVVKALILLAG